MLYWAKNFTSREIKKLKKEVEVEKEALELIKHSQEIAQKEAKEVQR